MGCSSVYFNQFLYNRPQAEPDNTTLSLQVVSVRFYGYYFPSRQMLVTFSTSESYPRELGAGIRGGDLGGSDHVTGFPPLIPAPRPPSPHHIPENRYHYIYVIYSLRTCYAVKKLRVNLVSLILTSGSLTNKMFVNIHVGYNVYEKLKVATQASLR